MILTDLPTEILLHISFFLNAKSLCSLSYTCKVLHYISKDDSLWQSLCQKDYQVSHKTRWRLSFQKIYTKILYPYPILGYQRIPLQPFGGLMRITWREGRIIVARLYGEKDVNVQLLSEPAFILTWNHETDALEVRCGRSTPVVTYVADISKIRSFITLRCLDKNCIENHCKQTGREIWNKPQSCNVASSSSTKSSDPVGKLKRIKSFNIPLVPLEVLPTPSHFPMTPGLYKEEDSIYILQVRVNKDNPYIMEFLKITGDYRDPAGNVSLSVYLDKPVILAEEDQSINQLISIDAARRPETFKELLKQRELGMDWVQRFIVPDNCYRDIDSLPTTCSARYLAQGVLNETFSSVHVMIIDKDTLGSLWLEKQEFNILRRVA